MNVIKKKKKNGKKKLETGSRGEKKVKEEKNPSFISNLCTKVI